MTDKKTFGLFIKSKRVEKNYSQKDLAELLFVTEGAISKWERGISYPDITMISDICRVLEISEHEFITASTDTETRKLQYEAKKFRAIRSAWFCVPTISYIIALVTCFICDLAINGTLSWFFIVFSSLVCAYSFVPGFHFFFKDKKLLVFSASTCLSIWFVLFTCSAYTKDFSWPVTACIGVLMGYVLIFLPVLLKNTNLTRFKFLITFSVVLLLTIIMIFNIHFWYQFNLIPAILITLYGFLPFILCAVICMTRFGGFLKAGLCTMLFTLSFYFTNYVAGALFGGNANYYQVDFNNWSECINGNISIICLISLLFISAVLITVGALKRKK